jgi:tetratricopeptide (TPR) repeat protein
MRVTGANPARVLVRITFAEEGFDYMEFVVETQNGRTRAVDWFQLSQGQLFSITVGALTRLFTAPDAGVLGRLFGLEKIDPETVATMTRFAEQKRKGQFREALATSRKLPDRIANDRVMLVVQASLAALAKDDAEYERVLGKIAARYSDDPGAAFMLMDHYFLKQDLPRFLKAIDAVEKRIGVDGVTRQLRAAGYYGLKDYATSLKYADESIGLEPGRLGGYDVRASALVGLGRFGDAIAQYKALEEDYELMFTREVFADDPMFEKFVASKEFKAWLPE